jgi:hypothetical protein
MDPFNGGEISPGPEVQTDEEILDWVRYEPNPEFLRLFALLVLVKFLRH